jgi:hypothetical protein
MANAIIRRPITAEDRARTKVSPFGICGGISGNGEGISPTE